MNDITTGTVAAPEVAPAPDLANLGEVLGDFKPYDAQLPIAEIAGTRIVKCLYQTNKQTGKKVAENQYVRIPTVHLTEEIIAERIAELAPYVLTFLQDQEDKSIKEACTKHQIRIYPEYLSVDKIVDALEAAEMGARLTKDKIEAWFSSELEEKLLVLFASKIGIDLGSELDLADDDKMSRLSLVLVAYKAKFASLASPKVHIKEEDCLAMKAVVESCGQQDSLLGKRFIARLDKMSDKQEELLLTL